jgi:hypothetical protein
MLIMTPEKGKVEILLGKSFDPELNEKEKFPRWSLCFG